MQKYILEDVLYAWLENGRIRLRPQTYAKYRQLITQHIALELGHLHIDELSVSAINQFLYDKNNNGRLDHTGGLSANYVRTIAFIVKSALMFAQQQYDIPLPKGEIYLPAKTKKQLDVLTIEEQKTLEEICYQYTTDKDLAILLSMYTGLRLGEVCGLQWQNINYHSCTMHIKHTVERIKKETGSNDTSKTSLMLLDTKTASSNRIIPFPAMLLSIMDETQTGFVVKGRNNSFIDPRTMQYFFQKRLKECGIRSVNYHALRHTFATRCIEAGMDIKSLSEILGHANVTMTMNIYVHSSIEHKRKQIEHMANKMVNSFL